MTCIMYVYDDLLVDSNIIETVDSLKPRRVTVSKDLG